MFQVVAARIPTTEEAQEMIRRGAGILAAILDWYEDGAAPCVTGVCNAAGSSGETATPGLTPRGDHRGDMQPEQQIGGGAAQYGLACNWSVTARTDERGGMAQPGSNPGAALVGVLEGSPKGEMG